MTKIEWSQVTWNPTTGCDRTSPGCDHCYALPMAARLKGMGQAKYQNDGDPRTSGPGFGLTVHPDVLAQPRHWRKPRLVFVNSMSDLFHPDVPDDFIGRVWHVMAGTPQHTYQVLTKRSKRLLTALGPNGCGFYAADGPVPCPQPNVHLGVSVESDRYAFRADHLRQAPAAVRFLSVEPMLGPVPSLDFAGIDWVILGGESGRSARVADLDWFADVMERARAAGARVFVKQLGSQLARRLGYEDPKGGDITEWPEWLRVREMPT